MKIKRIYEAAEPTDGYRILVDRIWPRGISKEQAHLDEWVKEIAPSTELRKWFAHIPERYPEFKKRYIAELKTQQEELKRIKSIGAKQHLTLLYAAKDEHFNQAVVLLEELNKLK